MKTKKTQSPAQKQYAGKIRRRKIRLYAVLIIAFILVLIRSTWIFIENYARHLEPQVNRAVIQVARLLPQLEQNEAMLADAYDQMIQSWERVINKNSAEYTEYIAKQDEQYNQLVGDTLSWMNRVIKLRVGRDGFMFVVSKEDNRILAHPNEDYVGRPVMLFDGLAEDDVISIKDIKPWTKPEDLDLHFRMIEPHKFARQNLKNRKDIITYFRMSLFGCVIDNGDTYIVCGVPVTEMLEYIFENAIDLSVFFLILMWLLVKWICLVMDGRRETAKTLRLKLISYAAIACILLFGISWYT